MPRHPPPQTHLRQNSHSGCRAFDRRRSIMIDSISLSNIANYINNLQVMSKLFHRKLALAVSSPAAKMCSARSTNTSWGSSPPLRTRGKGSNTSGEGQIREAMVGGDVVEVMAALPGQLFLNTQIPVCLWFLTNDKIQRCHDRRGKILFVDAHQMGTMEIRVNRVPADEDIVKIGGIVQVWRDNSETEHTYKDVSVFCYTATLEEIEKKSFVLTLKHYVDTADQEEDDGPFDQKMKCLTTLLKQKQAEGVRLNGLIEANLKRLRYEF
ncbi:MAG: hypothetical protein ERJ67_07040 [Aphanocapsa feldmannii 277cV]|uniref:DNA methylase adenine-specific domain-containing protein n=1 Tax=Aphanocapsa feldmannii 277cV TaxID=2507553 RepID=A0A524RMP0_9CHRO|nr:MAG: hypothetical protein ERJ67_07040 [Aphanocapsa feldmannii 277cV]